METKQLFGEVLSQTTEVIKMVHWADFPLPTPCKKWDVHKLVQHMLYELSWLGDLVEGKTFEEVGDAYEGDIAGHDLQIEWQQATDHALEAVKNADLQTEIVLPDSKITKDAHIRDAACDLLIHAWDLGTALGHPIVFTPEIAQTVYDEVSPKIEDWRPAGLVGEQIEVSDSADIQTKLLALYGRRA